MRGDRCSGRRQRPGTAGSAGFEGWSRSTLDTIGSELIQLVRSNIGAFANFKKWVVVQRLPKTRSGKILRKTMRQIADGQTVDTPATIDDPVILDEITDVLTAAGLGHREGV